MLQVPQATFGLCEVIALALFQQLLRGVESERSFLRDAGRFFSHLLFPGVVGLCPSSSFNRRVKKLRCFLEPLRREILPELLGEPETLSIDSTLLEVVLHPRQVGQSAGLEGAAWARWGSSSVYYGLKLHLLLCATNRVPISYELTAANDVAEVGLSEELLTDTAGLGQEKDLLLARRLLGDLAYRGEALGAAPAGSGILLVTERSRHKAPRGSSRWR